MRLVLDTNVALSAFLWGGEPRRLLDKTDKEQVTLLASEELLVELERVLSRPKFTNQLEKAKRTVSQIMTGYRLLVEIVEPAPVPAAAVRDPKDVMVLACAVGGRADYSVSGDQDLLELRAYANIPIITVTRCLELLSIDAE